MYVPDPKTNQKVEMIVYMLICECARPAGIEVRWAGSSKAEMIQSDLTDRQRSVYVCTPSGKSTRPVSLRSMSGKSKGMLDIRWPAVMYVQLYN